jgi:hypothetical protein
MSNEANNVSEEGEEPVIQAPMLTRGTAVAVDLCLIVAAGTAGFALISWFTPLDSEAASTPILCVMVVAVIYLVWGRNILFSAGRKMLGLKFQFVGAHIPGAHGRALIVFKNPNAELDSKVTGQIIVVMLASALASGLSLGQAVSSTAVFSLVKQAAEDRSALPKKYGRDSELASFPRALLIGKKRAFVQVGIVRSDQHELLDFYLARQADRTWRVEAVRESSVAKFFDYALYTPDKEIPKRP